MGDIGRLIEGLPDEFVQLLRLGSVVRQLVFAVGATNTDRLRINATYAYKVRRVLSRYLNGDGLMCGEFLAQAHSWRRACGRTMTMCRPLSTPSQRGGGWLRFSQGCDLLIGPHVHCMTCLTLSCFCPCGSPTGCLRLAMCEPRPSISCQVDSLVSSAVSIPLYTCPSHCNTCFAARCHERKLSCQWHERHALILTTLSVARKEDRIVLHI